MRVRESSAMAERSMLSVDATHYYGLASFRVIGYGGEEHVIRAGENFRFAKGDLHSVRAEKRFKMALLLSIPE